MNQLRAGSQPAKTMGLSGCGAGTGHILVVERNAEGVAWPAAD
ncbi:MULTISPECIES: hypothetical protein [Thioalkalivibrio]|nr:MULTISPECIES: hypothetical protein [Thioalkalivibrio]